MLMLTSWWNGIVAAARAPLMAIGIYVMLIVIAVPIGALLHEQLPTGEARLAPVVETPVPPDADWLEEVASGAGLFAATLSPAIVGVAAPITNLAAVIDARGWPVPAIAASVAYALCWAWLWGGVIFRVRASRNPGLTAFVGEATRHMPRMIVVSLIGIVAYAVLFFALHPLLFGPVFRALATGGLERSAFFWRLALAAIFGVIVVLVAQALDFARISIVFGRPGLMGAVSRGFRFVRRHPLLVLALAGINGLLLTALIAAYGATEFVPGGSVPRLSRIILIGQAYLFVRIVLRLAGIGAQVSAWQQSGALADQPAPEPRDR